MEFLKKKNFKPILSSNVLEKNLFFGSWNRFPTETVDDSSDDIMALRFFLPSLQKFYFKHSQYKILGYHSLATENMISQIFICDCHSYSCKVRFLSPYFLPQWFFFSFVHFRIFGNLKVCLYNTGCQLQLASPSFFHDTS